MVFIIQRIIFIFVMGILFLSCGLPDTNTIALSLNEPFITRIIPESESITVEFVSQNNEPAFSGYNIYFSNDETKPRSYSIRNQQQRLPTISANGSGNIIRESFKIEVGLYSVRQGTEVIHTLDKGDLADGMPLYIWVTSYQITPVRESSLYNYDEDDGFIVGGTPRFEAIEQTVNVDGTMTIEENAMATLVLDTGVLYFENEAGDSMQMRTASGLTDINTAPKEGYSADRLPVIAGRLYLIKLGAGDWENSMYGKIFVRSVNGTTSINVNYCLQTAPGILSY